MTPNVVSSNGVISAPKKRTSINAVKHMACVEIKVQVVLQFEVCRGRREVLLSPYGLSEIVAEFELKTSVPRQRDRSHSARSEERRHDDGVEGSTTLSDAVDAKTT